MTHFTHSRTAAVALATACAAVAGVGTAGAASLITGKQIKDSSIGTKDVKNGSLAAGDLSKKARASLRGQKGATGAQGLQGLPGEKGDKGDKGDQGLKGDTGPAVLPRAYVHRDEVHFINAAPATQTIATKTVPKGSYTAVAKFVLKDESGLAGSPDCTIAHPISDIEVVLDRVEVPVAGGQRQLVTLVGAVTVESDTGTIKLSCLKDGNQSPLTLRDVSMVLTPVSEVL